MRYCVVLLLLTWVLMACGRVDDPPVAATPVVVNGAEASPAPFSAEVDAELMASYGETIRLVQDVVAQQLGIEAEALRVTAVEVVDWPDGCLGLGQPDEACTEAIVPGLRIRLTIDDQIYEVRTDLAGEQYRWVALQ
jgi:hypothetical protein